MYPDSQNDLEGELNHAALERYWLGEASTQEREYVEAWFERNPQERELYEDLRSEIQVKDYARHVSRQEENVKVKAILNAAGVGQKRKNPVQDIKSPRGLMRGVYALSAALLVVVSLTLGWNIKDYQVSNVLSTSHSLYSTASGERATVVLPDGSQVMLNVASSLIVPADYAMGNRTVELRGEGLFEVRHASETPFTVIAGPSTTRVLGTSFAVRFYDADSTAKVSVRDGKVSVNSSVLTAFESIMIDRNSTVGEVTQIDNTPFSFERGVLVLASMRFKDAIAELNRWYDADIRLADEVIGDKMISGQFSSGSIEELSERLTAGLNVQSVRTGRVLTIHPIKL